MDGHFGCSHALAIIHTAPVTTSVFLKDSFLQVYTQPEVGLLDLDVGLFFLFEGTCLLLSIVDASIPTRA